MIILRGGNRDALLWTGPSPLGGHVRLALDGVNGAPASGVVRVESSVTIVSFEALDALSLAPRPLPLGFAEYVNRGRPELREAAPEASKGSIIVSAAEVASGWLPGTWSVADGQLLWLDGAGRVTEPPLPQEVERLEWVGGRSKIVRVTVPPRAPDVLIRSRVAAVMTVTAVTNVSDCALRFV